jgi:hypothetical protein
MTTTANTGAGNATTVQTSQPQTTLQEPGGPFIRYSFNSAAPMYTLSGQAFGALITQPLVSMSAYARGFRISFAAVGGSGATTATAAADAPWNIVAQVLLQDAEGNNIVSLDGYTALFVLPLINGSFGGLGFSDLSKFPSYSAIQTTVGAGAGNFNFETYLALEYLAGGIGVLGMNAASQLPQITFTLNTSAAVYTQAPATLPTITVQVDCQGFLIPNAVNIAPPQLGSSRQYKSLNGVPAASSSQTTPIYFPAYSGGYVDQLIFTARAAGARTDAAWPTRLKLYVDSQLVDQPTLTRLNDDFWRQFGVTRPLGVIVWNFRNSLCQLNLGLLDSAESYIATTSQSIIQLGDIFNGTASITLTVGAVQPSGAPVTGVTGA